MPGQQQLWAQTSSLPDPRTLPIPLFPCPLQVEAMPPEHRVSPHWGKATRCPLSSSLSRGLLVLTESCWGAGFGKRRSSCLVLIQGPLPVRCSAFSCVLTEGFTVLAFTEDVDPSVGRFRNMVQTAVVPVKVQSNSQLSN